MGFNESFHTNKQKQSDFQQSCFCFLLNKMGSFLILSPSLMAALLCIASFSLWLLPEVATAGITRHYKFNVIPLK